MAHQEIFNTHYNLLSALILANPGLVQYVGRVVEVDGDLKSSEHASTLFNAFWAKHDEDFKALDYPAIYTIWEVVYWAKTTEMGCGGKTWWDSIQVRCVA